MDKETYQNIENTVYDLFRLLDLVDDIMPDEELNRAELRMKKRLRKSLLDSANRILALAKQSIGG